MATRPKFREVNIARVAKYSGAMIGPERYLHRWTAPRNNFVRVPSRINDSPKSLVERVVDYKIYALPILGPVRSLLAPDEVTLKEESRALERLAAGPCNALTTPMSMADSEIGLGVDVHGIQIITLTARFRVATLFSHFGGWLGQTEFKLQCLSLVM